MKPEIICFILIIYHWNVDFFQLLYFDPGSGPAKTCMNLENVLLEFWNETSAFFGIYTVDPVWIEKESPSTVIVPLPLKTYRYSSVVSRCRGTNAPGSSSTNPMYALSPWASFAALAFPFDLVSRSCKDITVFSFSSWFDAM